MGAEDRNILSALIAALKLYTQHDSNKNNKKTPYIKKQKQQKQQNNNKKTEKAVKHRTAPQAARIYVHNQDFNALVLILRLCILVKDQS